MNPSASGWITKLLSEISEHGEFLNQSEDSFYCALKHSGFIYGNNKSSIAGFIDAEDLTVEEKRNLSPSSAFFQGQKFFQYSDIQ